MIGEARSSTCSLARSGMAGRRDLPAPAWIDFKDDYLLNLLVLKRMQARQCRRTYLEQNSTVPAEPDGEAADGDDDALLLLPQPLADRLPPHVQVPVLRPQCTPSKNPAN
jgi:hypothetical protein